MLSIYQRKKLFWDVGFLIYIGIVILIGFFLSIDNFFAFSNGVNINGIITLNRRGISIYDLIQVSSVEFSNNLQIIVFLILFILALLIIADIIYFKFLNEAKFAYIDSLQGFILLLWYLLFIFYGSLFSEATKPSDHNTIRVYGTGLFGILGLVSLLAIVIVETVIVGKALIQALKREKTIIPDNKIEFSKSPRLIYLIGFGIMAFQNIIFMLIFTLNFALIKIILFIDLIGITIILVNSTFYGYGKKDHVLVSGSILLFIWVISAFIFRISIGIYSLTLNSNGLPVSNDTGTGTISLFGNGINFLIISSFFLSGGLLLVLFRLFRSYKYLKVITLIYCISNLVSILAFGIFGLISVNASSENNGIFLLLGDIGFYGKFVIIPNIGAIMYLYILKILLTYRTSAIDTV